MKKLFTLKQLLVLVMLFGSLNVLALGNLVTKQITVKLEKAGTLSEKIADNKKYLLTNLKIVGDINGTDLRMIRDMAGIDYYGNVTEGVLASLDLSEACIVSGGEPYYYDTYESKAYFSEEEKLGECTFWRCGTLNKLELPSNLSSIGNYSFCRCNELKSLIIPVGVTKIGNYAFSGCSKIEKIEIPIGVTSIGNSAFEDCCSLTSLIIPLGVNSLGFAAFRRCAALTSIDIPFGISSIGAATFEGCSSLTSLTIPSSVTSIDNRAFMGCSSLTSVILPSDITNIYERTFDGCSSMTSMVIPANIIEIDNYAFAGCSGLTSIYVRTEKTPKMGNNVFDGCNAKQCTLYVPKGTYDDYWLSEFGYFENIEEFDATGIDKVTISTDSKELSRYSVNGQRLSAPTKGLNIVKYSDGSVKKVAVQ